VPLLVLVTVSNLPVHGYGSLKSPLVLRITRNAKTPCVGTVRGSILKEPAWRQVAFQLQVAGHRLRQKHLSSFTSKFLGTHLY
jgi:hypothetical protein